MDYDGYNYRLIKKWFYTTKGYVYKIGQVRLNICATMLTWMKINKTEDKCNKILKINSSSKSKLRTYVKFKDAFTTERYNKHCNIRCKRWEFYQ